MEKVFEILRFVAVLVAAGLLGNWFLSEVRRAKARREPWYKPYLTIPGIMVLIAVFIPLVYWMYMKVAR